ncbi:helix-turn-helix domain-containing protein [Polaromonas glacialis]|uniref:helix-turn-helix domain-containing protein n=1 Tax=Polaromonas glacialis TaxID=866564 RepID=UPI0018DD5A85|nr:helix-turn-helix transcriptional regulator [Polaromonas glacialis]
MKTTLGGAYVQAYNAHTTSTEVVPTSPEAPHTYNLRQDDLRQTGVQDEFDIDEYIEQQDKLTRDAIAAQGEWVVENFYPGVVSLATLRMQAGLSQNQFAVMLKIGQPHVSRYESGRHEPGVFLADAMAKALGVSLDQVVAALREAANSGKK